MRFYVIEIIIKKSIQIFNKTEKVPKNFSTLFYKFSRQLYKFFFVLLWKLWNMKLWRHYPLFVRCGGIYCVVSISVLGEWAFGIPDEQWWKSLFIFSFLKKVLNFKRTLLALKVYIKLKLSVWLKQGVKSKLKRKFDFF